MHEIVVHNHHRIGGIFTLTVYCVLCGDAHTLTEQSITQEQYRRILQVLLDVTISKDNLPYAKA